MRTESETIKRPRTSVVNNRFPAAGDALAYRGPAFGASNLAPHLGLRCETALPQQVPVRAPRPLPTWQCHSITLGTGVLGLLLTIRLTGMTGAMSFGVDLWRGNPRGWSPVSFETPARAAVWVEDDVNILCIGDARIVLKPRALALAVRWLEQHGIEVGHADFYPF